MKKHYSTWALIKDLYPFLRPFRLKFVAATLIRVVGDIAWLYPAFGIAQLVNYLSTYKAGESFQTVFYVFLLLLGASILRFGCGYIGKMIMFKLSERMDVDSQNKTIAHLFELDMSWHEHENTGNKLKKIVRGSDSVDRVVRIWINTLLPIGVNFIGITIVIANFDKTIAFLTLAFVITYYAFAQGLRKKASQTAVSVNLQEENLEGILFEGLNNIRTVKVLGMAGSFMEIILRESEDLYQKVLKRVFWFQVGGYGRGFYAQLFQLAMYGFIVYGIIHGQYAVGFLVLFSSYFSSLLQSVGELADVSQDYVVAKLSIGRMVELLNEPIGIDSTVGKVSFPENWKTITFKEVSFKYGDNEVLQDISFTLHRGEKIGVVGLSGAGKSTLFKLLLKEYESYTGEIFVDEIPLTKINKKDYFNYSAVVLQDTEVFNLSLKENITLANSAEKDNEGLFDTAIRVAHVKEFVARLPDGLETMIGEKGVKLSGGERQRLGIARAVFKNPELLLLDEATSHLDVESEDKIQSSLHEFFQSVTALVIAHRLTTIREMDRIILIEKGTVLEQGTFDELHAQKGRFYELWEKQSL
jgi:ABC-type multidrug transport system fused ATPase/permease subunit